MIWGVIAVIVLVIIWLIARSRAAVSIKSHQLMSELSEEIEPIISAFKLGSVIPHRQLVSAANDPRTRSLLYRSLQEIGHASAFPEDQARLELIAESDLVVWLMHPNELGRVPAQIELAQVFDRVDEDDAEHPYKFFLFRFKGGEDSEEWQAGVAGPYWNEEIGSHLPPCVFSRFEPFDKYTPEEHLRKTEELVLKAIR